MMSEDAVIRCDLWDIVTATQNRGCWELVSYTGATTGADQLQQAGVQLLTSFTRYSYHRHPEATAILLDSGGNEKSPRLSELQ